MKKFFHVTNGRELLVASSAVRHALTVTSSDCEKRRKKNRTSCVFFYICLVMSVVVFSTNLILSVMNLTFSPVRSDFVVDIECDERSVLLACLSSRFVSSRLVVWITVIITIIIIIVCLVIACLCIRASLSEHLHLQVGCSLHLTFLI